MTPAMLLLQLACKPFSEVTFLCCVCNRWNPTDLNDDKEFYSERGLNSLEILSYLALAYSTTGKSVYKEQFQKLALGYNYYENVLNQKIDNPVEDNHSDNELAQMAYHTLFYAVRRLERQLASETGKMTEQDILGM